VPPEQIQALIRLYGLDRPVLEQYTSWITAYVQIWRPEAWGYSFIDGRPVIQNIADRLPATFILMGTSLVVTIIVAIPIGVLAAVKQYSWTDKIITTFATIGYAIPSFLLGIYIWYLGGVVLADVTRSLFGTQWSFPLFGRQSLGGDNDPLDVAWHLVLPVTSLAIQSIAAFSRYLRASMLDVLRADYVRTARAKGAGGRRVIYKHALRNGLIPLITLVGLSIPSLVAGAVITEFIFSYPGLGQLTITAITQNDYPTIYATAMLIGIMVVVGNLLADVLYGVVDPRIKY
jgi:peptide/nickel transport system permease protein